MTISSSSFLIRLVLSLIFALTISACDKPEPKPELKIIVLNNGNIHSFQQTFLRDYVKNRNELLSQFKAFKKADDAYGFTQYRNYKWTPNYIEKKNYYQAVFKKNEAYISETPLKPLFLSFNNLLYIGVNLKNSLLDNNDALLKSTYAEIRADHAVISQFKK